MFKLLLATALLGAVSAGLDEEFRSEILAEHNKYRALHGVAELTWDEVLKEFAQEHCDMLAEEGKWEDSTGTNYGTLYCLFS